MFGNRFRSIIALFLFFPLIATTAPSDDDQNIEIRARAFEYNHKTGVALYTGNVFAQQGTRSLWGDKLEIYRSPEGKMEKIVVRGKPAKHESQSDPKKPKLTAKANEIIYYVAKEQLTLKENAYVEQGGDVYEAPFIEYDVIHETVRSPQQEQGKTLITLKPRARS